MVETTAAHLSPPQQKSTLNLRGQDQVTGPTDSNLRGQDQVTGPTDNKTQAFPTRH